jgi:signal transduction histidine kinase
MARELHDVTAHHLSVVAVQAEAGQALLPTDPAGADAALGRIASSARDALTDLRRSVAALRKSDESRHPQPGLDRLPALAEEVRAAGTPVELRVERDGAISDALEVSAYRIVQEALTNVLRHAPGTAADVAVRCRADAVVIEVSNPCDGGVAARTSGGGHGLVGLHERAAMLGGTLEAGRRDGRFVVRANLPR